MAKVKKPQKVVFEPVYDWHEISSYIKEKYGRDVRDWSGHFKDSTAPYQDFWHHICDTNEISNGSFFYLSFESLYSNEPWAVVEPWKKEIYQIIHDEFTDESERENGFAGDLKIWCSW